MLINFILLGFWLVLLFMIFVIFVLFLFEYTDDL